VADKKNFLDAAWAEVVEASEWYEARVEGLGDELYAEVDEVLDRIAALPRSGALWTNAAFLREVRRILLVKFPYAVVYVVAPRPIVIALAHSSRRPGYWAGRVADS
jgi:hypothetical protein